MKKRVIALLLAGLMTASLASCVAGSGNNGGGTEGEQTRPQATTGATVNQFNDVDQTVYVISNTAKLLTDVSSAVGALNVNKLTELHRVKVSDQWSVVEYNGTQYYIASASVTADDILGKNFTPVSPAATMYVASNGVNIRAYASAESFSGVVTNLTKNAQVSVIAKGLSGIREWSKIQFTDGEGATKEGFVRSDLLSATEVVDPDPVDYSKFFDALQTPVTMYVYTPGEPDGNINLRNAPTTEGSTWAGSLKNGTKVEVIATAKSDSDYTDWCRIRVERPKDNPNDPQFYDEYYVHTSGLSLIQGGQASSLDDLLKLYSAFSKVNKTMYVANSAPDGLNIRSTPDVTVSNNVITGFTPKTELKVVAQGTQGGVFFYVIEFQHEEKTTFGFVSAKYVTPDANGTPVQSLEQLLLEYNTFTKLDPAKTYVVTAAQVNCSLSAAEWSTAKTLAKDAEVTVLAQGTYKGASLYILEIDGNCYFADSAAFTAKA